MSTPAFSLSDLASDDLEDQLLGLSDDEFGELLDYARAELAALKKAWVMQPRQARAEAFLRDTDVFELLYGGAAGGGKSEWILHHFYKLATEYPGFHGLILRRTFPELRRSLIMRSWERFDTSICRYHASEHIWRFENGSTIEFGYCESDSDVYQYQSAEYDAVGWDELTQFPTDFPYTYLMSRCRTTLDKQARGLRPHIVAGTNPGGVGGAWVKSRFIDPMPPESVLRATVMVNGRELEVPRVFVPAKLSDNAYLGDDYGIALANLPPAIRAALMDGSWDVIEGQYFKDWNREIHVVDPFTIPPHWRRIRGIDYGYRNPFACLWIAFDPDGNAFVYRELYRTELLPSEQAEAILRASSLAREQVDYTVADPSIWIRTGAGPPIAQQYSDRGLQCRKANNARVDGWQRVREYLKPDRRGVPRLRIFSTCPDLIRTLPMLVHDDVRPEDLDTDGEDHAADALRYALMSRPLRARAPQPTGPSGADANVWERVRSRRKEKRSRARDGSPVGRIN